MFNFGIVCSQKQVAFSIGLLDLFGFENFKKNSLEQLIVNTTNEELQNAFYRNSICYNQQAYQQEGLSYHQVNYKDNRKTVDLLLQKPIGVFNVLKDSCKQSVVDEAAFVQNLKEYFGHHSEFISSKSNALSFGINHFAGKVKYDSSRFLQKSKEAISKNVFECLQKSQDFFIVDLFLGVPMSNGSFAK